MPYEVASQIFGPDVRVVGHLLGDALMEHAAFVKEVGAVGDAERFVDVVVGYEYAYVLLFQVCYDVLYVLNGNGVNSCKRLVEKQEVGVVG